jgi:5-methylthioadenosine/S-adenosylhomocysteine deaminase
MSAGPGGDGRAGGDLVVHGGTVLTLDGVADVAGTVVRDGAVAVAGGRIVAIGPSADVLVAHPQLPRLDAGGGIVLPGLVNAHTHLAMTMFRGLADDVDLQAFLGRMFPAEAAVLSPATVAVGAAVAAAESLLGGVTSALDMFWYPDATRAAAGALGLRVHGGPVFIGNEGPDGVPYPARLAAAAAALAADPPTGTGRWVFAHSAYTMTPEQVAETAALARAHGARFHIHAAENASEVDDVVRATGSRPVELLGELGVLGPDVVLAHAVHLTGAERDLLATTGTAIAHCPASNLKLASGLCPVPALLAAGVPVALGSDGAASSNDLDVLLAARLAALVHKPAAGDPTVVPARQALAMATRIGAEVLGVGDELGTLEVGKRGDLVVLHADRPHLVPAYDPCSTVVYAAGRGDVRHVVVDGRIAVRDGALTTADTAELVAELHALGARISAAV